MCVCDHWSHTSNKGDTKAKNEDWEDEIEDFLVHLRKKQREVHLPATVDDDQLPQKAKFREKGCRKEKCPISCLS